MGPVSICRNLLRNPEKVGLLGTDKAVQPGKDSPSLRMSFDFNSVLSSDTSARTCHNCSGPYMAPYTLNPINPDTSLVHYSGPYVEPYKYKSLQKTVPQPYTLNPTKP